MYKTLLAYLLLPLACSAQRMQFAPVIGACVGKGYYTTSACLSMKLSYDITGELQAGINGTWGDLYYSDLFLNWYPLKTCDSIGIFLGFNIGFLGIHANEKLAQTIWKGKGYKLGVQLGYTTPVFTSLGFFFELTPSVGWAMIQSQNYSGYASRGGFAPSPPEETTFFFIPIQLGLRYRF